METKNNDQPLVGIAMATYNPCLSYFIDQISSLKNQTYQNWKCVIVDDNSSETKFKNIQQIVAGDDRFELHRNNHNLGSFKTFERALNLQSKDAEFICFCDQDDIWISSKLEIQLQQFTDASVCMVHTDQSLIDEKGRVFVASCWALEGRSFLEASTDLLLFRNLITGCTTMFRRKVVATALPFYPLRDLKEMYHHDMWVAMHACVHGRVLGLKEPLVLYRQHGGNLVGVATLQRKIRFKGLTTRALWAFNERLGLRLDFADSLKRFSHIDPVTEINKLAYLDRLPLLFMKGFHLIVRHPLMLRTWVMLGVGLVTYKVNKIKNNVFLFGSSG